MLTSALLAAAVSLGSPPQDVPELPKKVMKRIDPGRAFEVVDTLSGFGTRHTFSETKSDTVGIGAARRWIHAHLKELAKASKGRMEVSMERFDTPVGRSGDTADLVNVLAVLPGSMPEAKSRHYYVMGHYDSRASGGRDTEAEAPGANDDASGVAVVLELARVLADSELDSTVVFIATAGEEQGLLGARRHVDAAVAEGRDIRGVLNNDIVGDPTGPPTASGKERSARHAVRIFSEGVPGGLKSTGLSRLRRLSSENDSPSRQLARFVSDVAQLHGTAVQPMLIFRPDRFLRGGDHTPFNDKGFPAVRFTEVYENYDRQHQDLRREDGREYGDLPEFVDPDYLADVTRLNAAALIHLANAPSTPKDVGMSLRGLSNDTTLKWRPSPEPDVAGYEVVWRATTSALWEGVLDVGKSTEATVELSKDNWFFGVRSYDEDGYRSPVAPAGMGR